MRKLAALVEHVKRVTGIPAEQILAYIDGGTLFPSGRDMGLARPDGDADEAPRRQVELGTFHYEALLEIERYNGQSAAFAAVITTWIAENEDARDGLPAPTLDVTPLGRDGMSDLFLSMEFLERLEAIEDPQGDIPFDGLMWSLVPLNIVPAETLAGIHGTMAGK